MTSLADPEDFSQLIKDALQEAGLDDELELEATSSLDEAPGEVASRADSGTVAGSGLAWVVAGATLVLIGLVGFYVFQGTPQYSLWQLSVAIQQHDLEGFNKRFDTEAVVGNLVDQAYAQAKAEMEQKAAEQQPENEWEAWGQQLGQSFANALLEGLKPKIKEAMTSAVETNIKRSILGLEKGSTNAPPALGLAMVRVEGQRATADIVFKDRGTTLPVTMQQQADRSWKIVAVDPQAAKAIANIGN